MCWKNECVEKMVNNPVYYFVYHMTSSFILWYKLLYNIQICSVHIEPDGAHYTIHRDCTKMDLNLKQNDEQLKFEKQYICIPIWLNGEEHFNDYY